MPLLGGVPERERDVGCHVELASVTRQERECVDGFHAALAGGTRHDVEAMLEASLAL